MKNKFFSICFCTAILLSLINCAKRSTPTGGEKDMTPPVMVSSTPEPFTTNFSDDEIKITFDEYIKLKDIQKQLIISPPLKYQPIITPQGSASKYIKIKINDTLRENTTYVFNFGQSITDNNEGNPYSYFNYIFSTGDYIDSLTVDGYITDARLKEPDNFVSVMLYEVDSTYTDSTIYKKPPTYITNTLDSLTTFKLTNLKAGKYALIAMKDEAGNYVFNQKTDKIAFISDHITIPTDSVFKLNLFKEIPDYKASRPSEATGNRILFGYEGNPDSMKIDLLSDTPEGFDYRITKDLEKDTLNYWYTPFEKDSLVFTVTNKKQIDTFTVKTRKTETDSLTLKPTLSGNLGYYQPFGIQSSTPIESIDTTLITIVNKDSLAIGFKHSIDKKLNQVNIHWKVDPNEQYNIVAMPGAIKDFYGNSNDTLNYNATTKSLADLGSIRVTVKNVKEFPIIVQLTDQKGDVKFEKYAETQQTLFEFMNIDPGKYYIRVIHDTNKNGIWDTGSYLKKIQPEKISYFPGDIDLRSNWELEQEFILE
ncbi:Ig-like domain-containing protein [Zhouia spongiae]|uniref:Ig-like domain-containing protein n=1 Tax=Zhouia spongiae TaxID=2202721 RepID=A0ABY3YR07_9FLAO|nr:Ig-like domain-containing protein [Zhouia spongiae]UNZ00094.1 Ig-like domain-containing protein [Zhouia spongiae]